MFDMSLPELPAFVVAVLAVLPILFFMLMQCAALAVAYTIHKNQSVNNLSPIPFLSMLVNGVYWSLYGDMKQDFTVFVPNFSSVIVGLICVIVYHIYSKYGIKSSYYLISLGLIIVAVIYKIYNVPNILGYIGVVMAVLLMGSPLATLGTVLKEKSTAALPFYPSLMTFFNALSWSLYGLLVSKDPLIYGPNLLGLILAVIQLLLFVIFGFPSTIDINTAASKDLEVLPLYKKTKSDAKGAYIKI